VDLPIPGSPPIRIALPGTQPAAQRAVELGNTSRAALERRGLSVKRLKGNCPPAS